MHKAAALPSEEMSLTESLLDKPSRFEGLTSQEVSALSHLVAALALVKSTDSADSPTLGTQAELYPLVAGFKRFKGSQGHLKDVEAEAAREKKDAEDEANEGGQAEAREGDKNDGEGDAFDLDNGEEKVRQVSLSKALGHTYIASPSHRELSPCFTR